MKKQAFIFTAILLLLIFMWGDCNGDTTEKTQPSIGPSALSTLLNTYLDSPFLKKINFKFKGLQDENANKSSLGFSYALSISKEVDSRGASLQFNCEGNVAFDSSIDPKDFLNVNGSYDYSHSRGGDYTLSNEQREFIRQLIAARVTLEGDALRQSIQAEKDITDKNHSNYYYLNLSLIGGLETDQLLLNQQSYYGFQSFFKTEIWHPDLAKWNIFDWPFAATRMVLGDDSSFTPQGTSVPSLLVGVNAIVPQKGAIKQLYDSKSVFPRLNIETSYQTSAGTLGGKNLKFEADGRYYSDYLGGFAYFAAYVKCLKLFGPLAGYISYSMGRLPLDVQSDKVLQLGFDWGAI